MRRIALAFALTLAALGTSIPAIAEDSAPVFGEIAIIDDSNQTTTINNVVYAEKTGQGIATVLGRFSGLFEFGPGTIGVDSQGDPIYQYDGFVTLTTADGSQLFLSFQDAVVVLTLDASGNHKTYFSTTVLGGTGRFANASGELDFRGIVVPESGPMTFGPTYLEVDGSISTD